MQLFIESAQSASVLRAKSPYKNVARRLPTMDAAGFWEKKHRRVAAPARQKKHGGVPKLWDAPGKRRAESRLLRFLCGSFRFRRDRRLCLRTGLPRKIGHERGHLKGHLLPLRDGAGGLALEH